MRYYCFEVHIYGEKMGKVWPIPKTAKNCRYTKKILQSLGIR